MAVINPERVLSDLRTLATFGAYKTGVHRPTLSPRTSPRGNGSRPHARGRA